MMRPRLFQEIAGLLLLLAAIYQIVFRGLDASTLALLTPALALLGFDLSGVGKGGGKPE